MRFENTAPIFDYRALRLMMGIIAFVMPFLVTVIAQAQLTSISASYHTPARDYFVGLLFVVAALMFAYNGHTSKESLASKGAGLSAVLVALFPTSSVACVSSQSSIIHGIAAITLFLILMYFCFGPFRENTKGKGGKKGIRAKLYFLCGMVMLAAMLAGLISKLVFSCQTVNDWNITYWVEAVALGAFGLAWIVAGKIIPIIVDEQESLKIFRR
jgi:hypothetical protein